MKINNKEKVKKVTKFLKENKNEIICSIIIGAAYYYGYRGGMKNFQRKLEGKIYIEHQGLGEFLMDFQNSANIKGGFILKNPNGIDMHRVAEVFDDLNKGTKEISKITHIIALGPSKHQK